MEGVDNNNDDEGHNIIPQSCSPEEHLSWTSTQGHILTGGGVAEKLFTAERGFSFEEYELPHYHLLRNETHEKFDEWAKSKEQSTIVTGAWNRSLFVGGWSHTTDKVERVYNLQSRNMFIDLRIPRSLKQVLPKDNISSLRDLSPFQLRLYARQHIFAGFSAVSYEKEKPLCTRHHCIDWNFVGTPRSRPNKWWIKMKEDQNAWKENSYSVDDDGQYYYSEVWERHEVFDEEISEVPRLALRKSRSCIRDGVLVIVGDHFNYVLSRQLTGTETEYSQGSLVDLVDAAVSSGDLETARAYLSIEGGHGRISKGWKLDCSIPFWNEGNNLWDSSDIIVHGESIESCCVVWKGERWDILDCNFGSIESLREFLTK